MASSTSFISCSSLPPIKYDVFLSFRGEDTRKNFTDHLFAAFVSHGFSTFIDDTLERGEEIGPELLKTIEGSKISVIVFSRNYADSGWCLDELVKILECKSTFQQMVLPVFYDVDPSEVAKQEGDVGKAFSRLEERCKGREMEGKLEKWRAALTEAANLSGRHLQNEANGHESKFIKKIVEDISKKLNPIDLQVVDHPVGIESRAEYLNELLSLESNDVRMIGILGIGGIGKTTIAKATYNLIGLKFEGRSFLANVREISKQPNGLVSLQKQLLSNILMDESIHPDLTNVDHGIKVIEQRLRHKRVLLVLDDVDDIVQLSKLAIRQRDWLHFGSRIIVTTRDKFILNLLRVDAVYTPELLNDNESLELFSWHAFGEDHPKEDYVELSRKVVGYAGGLPLAFEVLGSFLSDKETHEWKSALGKLKVIPLEAIQEKLRISYDSLNDEQKDIFLDIACFFVGMDKNYTIKILEGCCLFPKSEIGVLSRRCLVSIDESNQLIMMHDMLRDMGRDIVRRENRNEPGKRSRLWAHDDVLDVLRYHTGTEAVEGIVLNLPISDDVQVNAEAFAKMNRLRLLKLNYVPLSGSYEHISKRLSWLYWFGCPLTSIPSNLFMENVVAIDMPYSRLEQVWKGSKILNKLKFLNLSHSNRLTETPDFSGCTSLEKLLLNDCTSLVEVHQSIECLDKLVVLDMKNCYNLWKLPLGILKILKLTSLKNVDLSGCSKLEKLPEFKGSPSESQSSLFSAFASPVRIPDSIRHLPASIPGISDLNLANCNLSDIPNELGSLFSLRVLLLQGNNFCTLPDSISQLSQLWYLNLSCCTRLQSLPELPIRIGCVFSGTILEKISIGPAFREWTLPHLDFSNCHKIDESNIASYFRKCILPNKGSPRDLLKQRVRGSGEFSIKFPGGLMVPDYFEYQSEGSVLSFVVSLLPDQKIQGWSLCIITGHIDETVTSFFDYTFKNKTKDIRKKFSVQYDCILHKDHLCLYHFPFYHFPDYVNHVLQIDDGDEIEFSISRFHFEKDYSISICDNHGRQVKKCGVKLIYKDGEKDYQSNDQPLLRHSYGRESATMVTSLAAPRGTSRKRKHDDCDKSDGRKWKNPNVRPFFWRYSTLLQRRHRSRR